MTCLGMAAGPLLGGVMASAWGYRWPFVFVGAAMFAVTALTVLGLGPRRGPR